MQDDIFSKPIDRQFEFNKEVATVFDDMISRSIPGYESIMSLTQKTLEEYLKEGSVVCDIGCSTANLLIRLDKTLKGKRVKLIGIDNSADMLEVAKNKALAYEAQIELLNIDVTKSQLPLSDAFVANFTLQFIRPIAREEVIQKVYNSLKEDGIFLFAEKLISEDKKLNMVLIDAYHDYKKSRGYSELEIMRKREALENVLVPYTQSENEAICKRAGFSHVETLFRWCNFALFVALK